MAGPGEEGSIAQAGEKMETRHCRQWDALPQSARDARVLTKLTACPSHCPALREESRVPSFSESIPSYPEKLWRGGSLQHQLQKQNLSQMSIPPGTEADQLRSQQKPLRLSARSRKCLTGSVLRKLWVLRGRDGVMKNSATTKGSRKYNKQKSIQNQWGSGGAHL